MLTSVTPVINMMLTSPWLVARQLIGVGEQGCDHSRIWYLSDLKWSIQTESGSCQVPHRLGTLMDCSCQTSIRLSSFLFSERMLVRQTLIYHQTCEQTWQWRWTCKMDGEQQTTCFVKLHFIMCSRNIITVKRLFILLDQVSDNY